MSKIKSLNACGLLLKYILKIIFSTVLSVVLLNSIFSFALLKLDIDLKYCSYIGIAICAACSLIISYISTGGFKNSIFPLSLISVLPFILFVIINFFIAKGDFKILIVKLILIIVSVFISSFLRLKRVKG